MGAVTGKDSFDAVSHRQKHLPQDKLYGITTTRSSSSLIPGVLNITFTALAVAVRWENDNEFSEDILTQWTKYTHQVLE